MVSTTPTALRTLRSKIICSRKEKICFEFKEHNKISMYSKWVLIFFNSVFSSRIQLNILKDGVSRSRAAGRNKYGGREKYFSRKFIIFF